MALSLFPECEKLHYPRLHRYTRIATLGGSTIARLILEHQLRVELPGTEVMRIGGRGPDSNGAVLVIAFGVPFTVDTNALLALKPPAVLAVISRDAVRAQWVPTRADGVSVIAPSAKALADDGLQMELEASAAKSGALLYTRREALEVGCPESGMFSRDGRALHRGRKSPCVMKDYSFG